MIGRGRGVSYRFTRLPEGGADAQRRLLCIFIQAEAGVAHDLSFLCQGNNTQ
jgi:hypothetical protein